MRVSGAVVFLLLRLQAAAWAPLSPTCSRSVSHRRTPPPLPTWQRALVRAGAAGDTGDAGDAAAEEGVSAAAPADGASSTTWEELGSLPKWLLDRTRALGFETPSSVQSAALPAILRGSDAIVQAQTGSGKTLAYLLPIIAAIDRQRVATQAVVIVPTRELGLQVSSVAKQLTARTSEDVEGGGKVLIMSLLEGSQNRRQRAWAWAEPPHIVVANPSTLEVMLKNGGLRLNELRIVVVDEVDACADMSERGTWREIARPLLATARGGSQLMTRIASLPLHPRYSRNHHCGQPSPPTSTFSPITHHHYKSQTPPHTTATTSHAPSLLPHFSGAALHKILGNYISPTYDDVMIEGGAVLTKAAPGYCGGNSAADSGSGGGGASGGKAVRTRQSIFLSASIPQPKNFVRGVVQRRWCINEPEWILVTDSTHATAKTPSQLEHYCFITPKEKKLAALRKVLRQLGKDGTLKRAIVFCNRDRPLEQMALALDHGLREVGVVPVSEREGSAEGGREQGLALEDEDAGYDNEGEEDDQDDAEDGQAGNKGAARGAGAYSMGTVKARPKVGPRSLVAVLHEDAGLNARAGVMDGFRRGEHVVLLATDLAARGLDVPEMSHVIQFDMPASGDLYLHRAGRTGRMGRAGTVVTLASKTEDFVLSRLANGLGIDMYEW